AWLHGVDDLRIEPYALDQPLAPDAVRVRVGAVGICGSDVHYLKHMRIADFVVEAPMVIGHESAGIVEDVGSAVTDLKAGDRVAMEPGIPCRRCLQCKTGFYNLCPDMAFFATPPVHGSLARFVTHPADFCFKLPDGMTLEQGAMCEPVSVGVHACKRAEVGPGQRVAILGAGPIGLVTLMVAIAHGAARVVVTDVAVERLKTAAALGASAGVDVGGLEPAAAAAKIREALGGDADAAIDCCGFEPSVRTALLAARPGGRVCLVGMGHNEMRVPLTAAAAREVDIVGVFRYRNAYPLSIELISSGKIDVGPLITHRYDLGGGGGKFSKETVAEAFEQSARGKDAIKVRRD
ncbi:unnamed protein product, partial [Phaeothamnion confervicola]